MTSFLIVRLGSLGDVVHAIPFAAALRENISTARIDWLTDPRYVELLELVTGLDNRLAFDPRHLFSPADRSRMFRTMAATRRVGYDVVFDLQGLLKSAVVARLAGGRQVVGLPRQHLREPLASFFYDATPDPGAAAHVIEMNLALLAAAGVADRRVRFPLVIPQSPTVDAVVRDHAGGFVLINPGAAWPNKRWAPARFGEVATALRREAGITSVVLWGPGEEAAAAAVVGAAGGAAVLAPATAIPDLCPLAADACVMVSGDTGPLHLAAALGTPVVAIFGPTLAERNGPFSSRDVTVARTEQCACLYRRRCRRRQPCLDDLGTGEVMAAVRRRLEAA